MSKTIEITEKSRIPLRLVASIVGLAVMLTLTYTRLDYRLKAQEEKTVKLEQLGPLVQQIDVNLALIQGRMGITRKVIVHDDDSR